MKIDIRFPPVLRRRTAAETADLNEWCSYLVRALKQFFNNIDDDNIRSVSTTKITGDVDVSKNPIKGGVLTVTADSFRLATADGSQYIELVNGVINIHANII